jgi:hypothetical protein
MPLAEIEARHSHPNGRTANRKTSAMNWMIVAAAILQITTGRQALKPVGYAREENSVRVAQDSATAVVDECRRIALEEYTNAAADYDSHAAQEKENFDIWSKKELTLLAAAKKTNAEIGRFGDAKVFDSYARSPAKIAERVSTEVETTLRAVSSALTTLDGQLSVTPRDPVLYCSYATVFYHRNILQKLSGLTAMHHLTLQEMENYFQIRIKVSSAISKTEYQKDRDEINEALLDLYEGEVRTAAHMEVLLKQLTKQ